MEIPEKMETILLQTEKMHICHFYLITLTGKDVILQEVSALKKIIHWRLAPLHQLKQIMKPF